MTAAPVVPGPRAESLEQSVDCVADEAPGSVPHKTSIKVAGVPSRAARTATTERSGRFLRARWSRGRDGWSADEVAAHLVGCRAQMIRGLARKSPWAGLDDETLESCFHYAAAVIAKIAASGQRSEWRTPKDLEKAQIAAFRHQALDHWRRVNAQSRQGDRFTVAFDPDRHAAEHAPIDRLFEQPDLHTIERDLLAELADDRLRAFWSIVLLEQVSFKEAGDRLELSKSAVMACTRAGRAAFAGYLDQRASGELCRDRALDIAAHRAGSATRWRIERAEAHLESCYACALVHEPRTSAIERGILGLAPTGFILRLLSRAGDAASAPAMRIVESGSGSRAVAAGLAAVAAAGVGVGTQRGSEPKPRGGTPTSAAPAGPSGSRTALPPPAFSASPSSTPSAKPERGAAGSKQGPTKRTKRPPRPVGAPNRTETAPLTARSTDEFEIEVTRTQPPVHASPKTSSPPALEFDQP